MNFKHALVKIKLKIINHKIITAIVLLVLAGGGYYFFGVSSPSQAATRYVLGTVKKDMLIISVAGTGQVAASSQVDVKAKASGDATYIGATQGQEVKSGALLVQLNTQDAQKTLRDAQASLDNAKLSLAKVQEPATKLSLLQAENSLAQAKESKGTAQDSLAKSYDDGFNNVANAFLDLPTVMTGLQDILFSQTISVTGQWNLDYYLSSIISFDERGTQYRNDAYDKYQIARQQYDLTLEKYKSITRFSDKATIEALINETYETTKSIAEAIKSANNLLQFYKDTLAVHNQKSNFVADTHLISLTSYTSKTNSLLLTMLSSKSAIKSYQESIVNTQRSIDEKTESLTDLKAGADELELRTQELAVSQKEDDLLSAKEALANYSIRAPFDGIISAISLAKGDSVSSGAAAFTIITKQQIAEISLNEVDVAKVKVGQKATLTFDAVENLSITGQVVQIDIVGTASQGVVNYTVKISFDAQDERIKPGMSASAAIITDSKADVLVVPVSAVKTSNGQSYVEVVSPAAASSAVNNGPGVSNANKIMAAITLSILPQRQAVETGLINDSYAEILSGLSEGDAIVAQTVNSSSGSSSSSSGNKNSGPSGSVQMMRMF